jgi:hypothetical protein
MAALAAVAACGGGSDDVVREPPRFDESPQFRAISGISMGAYGALNIGTKHPEGFGTIAALGGPVDLGQLLRDTAASGLEVKAQATLPRNVGDDFTFDHLPPYPGRDVNLSLLKDLLLILTHQLQNMFVVFLPGDGGVEGSFFVNHRVPEEQVPDVIGPTSGRYEDSILQDLIPAIERDVLHGRVRR